MSLRRDYAVRVNAMVVTKLFLAGLIASIPPLSDDQTTRVAGAVDGADYHDEAFLALVENARQWKSWLGDVPIRLNPDEQAMLNDPANFRGEVCRIDGALQQATRLAPPYEDVVEWFVRGPDQRVAIVYVAGAESAAKYTEWDAVVIDARFYKRMEFTSRDGVKREYPAFVGAFPRMKSISPAVSPLSIVAGLVALLAVVFIGLMMWARRVGGGRHDSMRVQKHRPLPASADEVDDRVALPDDPAGALSALKRQAESD